MKYRKKPVKVEAVPFSYNAMALFNVVPEFDPDWFIKAIKDKTIFFRKETGGWYVRTLEGEYIISDGDFIIQGVKGELYPCKPDIFKMTYKPVSEE